MHGEVVFGVGRGQKPMIRPLPFQRVKACPRHLPTHTLALQPNKKFRAQALGSQGLKGENP
jgi:hypothetical protein